MNLNPLSPDSDSICEQIYKRVIDSNGNIQDRFLIFCEAVGIDLPDIALKYYCFATAIIIVGKWKISLKEARYQWR